MSLFGYKIKYNFCLFFRLGTLEVEERYRKGNESVYSISIYLCLSGGFNLLNFSWVISLLHTFSRSLPISVGYIFHNVRFCLLYISMRTVPGIPLPFSVRLPTSTPYVSG